MTLPALDRAEEAACRARLVALDTHVRDLPPIARSGCDMPAPLEVSRAGGVDISAPVTINCRTAEALALYIRDAVAPAARAHLGTTPVGITQASGYVCRTRNGATGAKMSEHATGNAIDIAAIRFADGRTFTVGATGETEPMGRFGRTIRESACRHFFTVLGPGSDAAHADHLHLDMAARRNRSRFCR